MAGLPHAGPTGGARHLSTLARMVNAQPLTGATRGQLAGRWVVVFFSSLAREAEGGRRRRAAIAGATEGLRRRSTYR